jgi:biotin operon repressor
MMKKAMSIFRDEEYLPAKALGEKLGMRVSAVYRLVRMFREDGVGIHPNPKGYILSEFATKNDDVHFLRRLNGRRVSDILALRAAEHSIRKRWTSVADRRNFLLLTGPLQADLKSLEQGKIILSAKNKKGI